MRPLTARERRTLRLALIFLGSYLLLFYGLSGWKRLEAKRAEYEDLRLAAATVVADVSREAVKARRLRQLRESSRMKLERLHEESMVGEARASIQAAAQACGIKLGTSRESPGRPAARELAAIDLDGVGPTTGLVRFLWNLPRLGYPLVLDRINVQTTGMEAGTVRFSLNVVILNFAAWKPEEKANA